MLIGKSEDFALLELTLSNSNEAEEVEYHEKQLNLKETLKRLARSANVKLPGNFTLLPDFRLFIGNKLYLVKPTSRRHWMRSSALEDADAIAMDINSYLITDRD